MKKAPKAKRAPRTLALLTSTDHRLRESIQRQLPPGFSGTVIYRQDKAEFVKASNDRGALSEAQRAWGRLKDRKRLLKIKF